MRSFVVAAALCAFLGALVPGTVGAVGLYVVGKEDCDCSPLVARGIYPDTLNKIQEAVAFPQIALALDRVAVELRGMLDQGGGTTTASLSEQPGVSEEVPEIREKEEKRLEKAPAVKKPRTHAKVDKKPKKKKRVTQPPRAM
jgi:protoporphyrinogen oxidase